MQIQLIGITVVAFLCLISAFFVLFSGQVSVLRRITFTLCQVGLIAWMFNLYFSNIESNHSLFLNRIVYVSPIIAITSLALFMDLLGSIKKKWFSRVVLLTGIATAFISVLPGNVRGVSMRRGGDGAFQGYSLVTGPLINLVMVGILVIIGLIIYRIISVFRHARNESEKSALKIILITLGITIAVIVVANLILPIFTEGSIIANLIGSSSLLVFSGGFAYSLLRHRFLDVRYFVVRLLAYVFSIGIIISAYITVIYVVAERVLGLEPMPTFSRTFYILSTILVAVTFHEMKGAFNKITSRIFYKDAYETQAVLDKVSSVIVGNVDPHKVQKGALTALNEALKASYVTFLLYDSTGRLHKGDVTGQQWDAHSPEYLTSILKQLGKEVVIYDELGAKREKIKDCFRGEDINLVAPLITKDEIIGYLILGPKKSGNVYNSQDTGLLRLVTNELAVALQNAQRFEEIQAFNVTLQKKITDATHELKTTNKKLIALDEAKDEFISMASHQLRTPLTSIKGYISMLIEGDLGKLSAPQEKALKEAFGSSQRMVYLIADFLNVSRIKTGKFMIETKEVDLPEIVREELTQLREMAGSRDLKLVYEQPEVFPRVMLDDNKIRQVMMNMVDNAIYYTPTGGTITIQLYSTGDEVIFKVIDTGIGVPRSEQHKLFTKFYRAGNARKSRPDGTGLGLFMAQKIIVEQGGAIIFESQEGKGSTFGFRFPLSKIKA